MSCVSFITADLGSQAKLPGAEIIFVTELRCPVTEPGSASAKYESVEL